MSVEKSQPPKPSTGSARGDETQVATEARLPSGDAPAQGPLAPGAVLGHYRVLRHIGTGGMGHIHAAEDLNLQREVALKVATRADGRTLDEARALAALNHPNVVTIYELGSHEGSAYIVMELLRGGTLRDVLAARRPTPDEVRAWATDALEGIDAAHAVGVLHLDLKPDNLFVTQSGALKLLDFGVARRWRPGDDPGEGTMAGTLPYMAPEMILGRPVDARADLFSLGVILHELATGMHPFRGRDRVAALQRGEEVSPPPGVSLDDPAVALEHGEVDVGALVRDVCRSRALADPEGPEIRCEARDVVLALDPERFQQVVVNLVGNAQRHARGGGAVHVTLEAVGSGAETALTLRVDDDGPGVPEELLPRLGERLMRVDPSRTRATGGSGLGLAIVRAIVERHGGQLSFARSPAGGLRVEVRLSSDAIASRRRDDEGV